MNKPHPKPNKTALAPCPVGKPTRSIHQFQVIPSSPTGAWLYVLLDNGVLYRIRTEPGAHWERVALPEEFT